MPELQVRARSCKNRLWLMLRLQNNLENRTKDVKILYRNKIIWIYKMENIKAIFEEIEKILITKQEAEEKLEFNIFSAISDVFYRENFHSDVLCMLLKRKEIFASLIKYLFGDFYLEKIDHDSLEFFREYNYIDIFVRYKLKGEDKPHCIILENKINDAVDQERQLIRYYECCEYKERADVDKIIYLIKEDNRKNPEYIECTPEEIRKIEQKLWIIDAENFCEKILNPKNFEDENISSALIQYRNLINYIKGSPIMCANEKIYEFVKNDKNKYKILKDFCDVFNNFPNYVAKDVFESMKDIRENGTLKYLRDSACNKNFIFFDSDQIKDNRKEYEKIKYGFRLEFCFELDSFCIQFRYYGYSGTDDAALKKIVKKDDILKKKIEKIFAEKIEREYSEMLQDETSIKYIFSIDEFENIEKIKEFLISEEMKNFYSELNRDIEDYLKNLEKPNTENNSQ